MPIYRLDPIDKDNPDWRVSTHRSVVIVRAPTEYVARLACMHAFRIGSRIEIGQSMPSGPWTQRERATCKMLSVSDWPIEGPTEILQPTISPDGLRKRIAGLTTDD